MPRPLRDFQAGWESRLLDFSSARLFHALACCQFQIKDRTAALVVATEAVRPIAEAECSVQCVGAQSWRSLPAFRASARARSGSQVLKGDRVVPVHRALELQRKHALQIFASIRRKGRARLRRGDLEAAIEL